MSDQPSPARSNNVTDSQLFFYVVSQGVWLTLQSMLTLAGAIALARFDAMHDHQMGPLYLTAVWSCWWVIVLSGWAFMGLAYGWTLMGLLALNRTIYAGIFLFVGGLVFVTLTALLIATARTFAGAIWL